MLSIQKCTAIFTKQIKDVFKNKQVLILFLVYPVMASILVQSIGNQTAEAPFFITLFSTMHSTFTPIVVTAAIIGEEKEKNTLRMLILSDVHPLEYLISIGSFVLLGIFLTSIPFLFLGSYNTSHALYFLLTMILGSLISLILGMTIGAHAPNLMAANGLAIPIAMFFAFIPMLASFNTKINTLAQITYSQQISHLITNPHNFSMKLLTIILANALIILLLFTLTFKKNRLEN